MKFFSACSGECIECVHHGFCLAGHGDDDFCRAPDDVIAKRKEELKNHPIAPIPPTPDGTVESCCGYQYKKFGSYASKVVVKGNCSLCGSPLSDEDNIFLCNVCMHSAKMEGQEKRKEERANER